MAAAVLPISRWYQPDRFDTASGSSNPGSIRLNSNENPYGPSESVRKAILDNLTEVNRYPWNAINSLKEEIAARENLTSDHVMITAGSTELLGLAGLAHGMQGGELVACHPTFDFLLVYAERLGCTWARTPLDKHFQYDLHALDNIVSTNTKLIFICNPNNPTGMEIPFPRLRSFCDAHASKYPVYVDEAYIELSPHGRKGSMAELVSQLPNLIIGRTFSKVHGLAGMRIGYALAHPDMIKKMSNLHTGRGMSISGLAAAAAMASLNDPEFEAFSRSKIIEGREKVSKAFDDWNVKYLPSATNFIFFQNDTFTMDPVEAMEKENILLRKYDYVPGWSRVSIGTTEEVNSFLEAIGKYVS
jgi:histidinol-phosphate aminotransferase